MSGLSAGDVVTITLPDTRFTGKQGVVVNILNDGNPDGPIGVRFPEYYKFLFDFPNKPDTVIRFTEADLKKNTRDDKQDITQEQLCDVLFGKMWHSIYSLKRPLMIGFRDCTHKNCSNKVAMRIMVNCHGTVQEIDVCKNHVEYHGRNCDDFPHK